MGPMLGKTGPASKIFLEDRRNFLFWLIAMRGSGRSEPSYLVNEDRDYILIGGDRIVVREARS